MHTHDNWLLEGAKMVVAISPDKKEDTVAGVLIVYDRDDPDVKLILNHLKLDAVGLPEATDES